MDEKPKRRWFQFRLSTWLVVVGIAAAAAKYLGAAAILGLPFPAMVALTAWYARKPLVVGIFVTIAHTIIALAIKNWALAAQWEVSWVRAMTMIFIDAPLIPLYSWIAGMLERAGYNDVAIFACPLLIGGPFYGSLAYWVGKQSMQRH